MAIAIPAAIELATLLGPEAASLIAELGGPAVITKLANNFVSGHVLKEGKKMASEIFKDLTTTEGRDKVLRGAGKVGRKTAKLATAGANVLGKVGLLNSHKVAKVNKLFGSANHGFQSALGKLKKANKFLPF